jgi:hypothetical protein
MKKLTIISMVILLFSCTAKNNKRSDRFNKLKDTISNNYTDSISNSFNQNEVMLETDIFFKGKLNRYFTLNEFQKVFGKTDSIKLMSQESPCNCIFENEDGSKDVNDKYFYKEGSRFENSKEKMAVDEFRFSKNNFILYKGINLNSSTTLADLEILFPKAIKNLQTIIVFDEGELQVIKLREDENNISDGHLKLFIKDGKLYFMHWWFPC